MGIREEDAEKLSNKELSGEFARSKGEDKVAGTEIMKRVVGLAGLNPDEWLAKPLKGKDGQPVTAERGEEVTVEDYLTVVAPKHPGAVKGILTFLNSDTSGSSFATEQTAMAGMIQERT